MTRLLPAAALLALIAAPAQAQVNVQITAPTSLIGTWSEARDCAPSATRFVFASNSFEIADARGRQYSAAVNYVSVGGAPAIRVTQQPSVNRFGANAPALGDSFIFRRDGNSITPVAILRGASRHPVGADSPSFTRCR